MTTKISKQQSQHWRVELTKAPPSETTSSSPSAALKYYQASNCNSTTAIGNNHQNGKTIASRVFATKQQMQMMKACSVIRGNKAGSTVLLYRGCCALLSAYSRGFATNTVNRGGGGGGGKYNRRYGGNVGRAHSLRQERRHSQGCNSKIILICVE